MEKDCKKTEPSCEKKVHDFLQPLLFPQAAPSGCDKPAYSLIRSSSVTLTPDEVRITLSSIYRSFISAYTLDSLSTILIYRWILPNSSTFFCIISVSDIPFTLPIFSA